MATTAAYGVGAWGAAAWGSSDEVLGSVTRTPPTGAVTLAGNAPTVLPIRTEPLVGSLTLTGAAAIVTSSSVAVIPLVGSLALLGTAPVVFHSAAIRPPAGALAFLGLTPGLLQTFIFQVQWDADVAMQSLLLLDWEVGPAPAIIGGVLPLEWSLDELLDRLRLDWDVYQIGLEAAYDEDPQRPWARVNAL
jgi:hypothetical protein